MSCAEITRARRPCYDARHRGGSGVHAVEDFAAEGVEAVAAEEFGGGGQGITEASILLEEIAASGAAMNGASAVHLSIFGMNPVVNETTQGYMPPHWPCRRLVLA